VIALQEIEAAQRRIHDQAVRTPAERAHVIAEDAGALATAAALNGDAGNGKVVCIVSGGNINLGKLAEIFQGGEA
jgi:threonine dehydratase